MDRSNDPAAQESPMRDESPRVPTHGPKRLLAQALAALCQNPFVQNLATGTVYNGNLKAVCAPGLNCHSCPAAAGACPIGALQAVANTSRFDVSFYAIGFLVIFGAILGRAVCGFLCIFGLLQDALYRIPTPKLRIPERIDRPLRKLKHVVLVLLVLVLPACISDQFGLGAPFFCEYLCPAGVIEAALPLLAANEGLRAMAGALFSWKAFIAAAVVIASMFVYRPFCKYLCPLGAFYALFNRISFVRMRVDRSACTSCGSCERTCPMNVKVLEDINSGECIRCGACKRQCPVSAIHWVGPASIGREEERAPQR